MMEYNPTMTLRAIIEDWLKAHHYDGLYHGDGDGCACESSDLMPCDEPSVHCSAGIKIPCDGALETCSYGVACKWHIVKAAPCKHGMAKDCAECRAEKRARIE